MVFMEGLDNYDVARPSIGEVFIHRPTLAEISSGWKPKNTVHLEEEEEEEEEVPIHLLPRFGWRRALIPDVWYVRCWPVIVNIYADGREHQ